jgi:hypothetical protein
VEDDEQAGGDEEVADAHDVAERPGPGDGEQVTEREQVGAG